MCVVCRRRYVFVVVVGWCRLVYPVSHVVTLFGVFCIVVCLLFGDRCLFVVCCVLFVSLFVVFCLVTDYSLSVLCSVLFGVCCVCCLLVGLSSVGCYFFFVG